MTLKYDIDIDTEVVEASLKRLINQIYKLLPNREENLDWETPLTTIIEELGGMSRLLPNKEILFSLLCKLEGLFLLINEDDFFSYRRTIFDCLNLAQSLKEEIKEN